MRRPIFLIFTNAMILLVIFALLTQSLVIVQRLAVAQAVTGEVEVQRGGKGEFRALKMREFVKSGDIIRTSHNGSAEFKWADGTRCKVMPDTQLLIKKAVSNTLRRAEDSELQLTRGKVFVRITKKLAPESQFKIETPNAIASVRGTIFSVQIENNQTRVQVLKGEVDVSQKTAVNTASGENFGQDKLNDNFRDVETNRARLMPGQSALLGQTLQMQRDDWAMQDFSAQPSMVQPELQAQVQADDGGRWLVSGSTEAGDSVWINGQKVRVWGNGVFRKSLLPNVDGRFVVKSKDPHGAIASQILTPNAQAQNN